MHAALVSFHFQPDKVEEAVSVYNATVAPAFRQQPGAVSVYLLVNPGTGRGFSLGIWESEEAAKAFEASGTYAEVIAHLSPCYTTPPVRHLYPVLSHFQQMQQGADGG